MFSPLTSIAHGVHVQFATVKDGSRIAEHEVNGAGNEACNSGQQQCSGPGEPEGEQQRGGGI